MHSSSLPSPSSSPEPADTMNIFIKNVAGNSKSDSRDVHGSMLTYNSAIPITVPQDLSVRNLTTLVSLRTSLPESDLRLVYAGKHLSPSSTLAEINIQKDSVLHLAVPLRGGMPPKKIRCTYKDCREGAQRIIGDCGFCNGHFCGKHRLLEDHKCDGLEDVSTPNSSASAARKCEPQWWLVGLDYELLADILCCDTVQEGVS